MTATSPGLGLGQISSRVWLISIVSGIASPVLSLLFIGSAVGTNPFYLLGPTLFVGIAGTVGGIATPLIIRRLRSPGSGNTSPADTATAVLLAVSVSYCLFFALQSQYPPLVVLAVMAIPMGVLLSLRLPRDRSQSAERWNSDRPVVRGRRRMMPVIVAIASTALVLVFVYGIAPQLLTGSPLTESIALFSPAERQRIIVEVAVFVSASACFTTYLAISTRNHSESRFLAAKSWLGGGWIFAHAWWLQHALAEPLARISFGTMESRYGPVQTAIHLLAIASLVVGIAIALGRRNADRPGGDGH